MAFSDRVSHLYSVAFATFPVVATYAGVEVTLVRNGQKAYEMVGNASKVYARYFVRLSEVASPAIQDSVVVAGDAWRVFRVRQVSDEISEITIVRDERVKY